MAQPSGQLSLKTANASEFFYYAQGTNGLWDARNGALLSKTGTAGMTTEGGAQVVLGDAATQYNLPSAINITGGAWTVIFKARISSGAGTNSMPAGDATGTADFFWLSDGSGNCAIRLNTASYSFANSGNTTLATYAWVYAGTQLKLFKNGSLVNTFTGVASGAALKISAILAGYSGGSFRLNGALEFLNAIPSALSDAEIASRTSDPYAVLEAGGGNAAPTFTGPNIGNQTGTVGTALSNNNVASKFSDSDALTFSAVGSWPPGVTVSSAGVISGTPTAAGTYSGLAVRATDTAAQTVDSDTFSFTISVAAHLVTVANSQQVNTGSSAAVQQAGNGTITLPALKDWGTGNLKANETGVTIIVNNATTGALVNLLTGQTANASGVLPTLTGLVSGTAYRVTTILADGSEGTWKYTAS